MPAFAASLLNAASAAPVRSKVRSFHCAKGGALSCIKHSELAQAKSSGKRSVLLQVRSAEATRFVAAPLA